MIIIIIIMINIIPIIIIIITIFTINIINIITIKRQQFIRLLPLMHIRDKISCVWPTVTHNKFSMKHTSNLCWYTDLLLYIC